MTRRNIDVGSLVQGDTTSGTFMFTLVQSDVMRIRLYVPQDAAIGVTPGIDAVARVPEIPDRTFPGKVARIADALDPATACDWLALSTGFYSNLQQLTLSTT